MLYNLEHTPAQIRGAVINLFRKNQAVTDPRVIDIHVMKGQLLFEEVMLQVSLTCSFDKSKHSLLVGSDWCTFRFRLNFFSGFAILFLYT